MFGYKVMPWLPSLVPVEARVYIRVWCGEMW